MPANASSDSAQLGFFHKPIVEKLKLLALFALIAALIYFATPTPREFLIGSIIAVIGTLIRVWAAGHLTRDKRLTTSGPYQFTRNPFYLGRLLLIIGFAVMSGIGNPIVIGVLSLALLVFFAFYMPRKEKREGGRLQKLFGPDYETWKQNVPSLFPRLTPYRMNPRPWNSKLFFGGEGGYSGNKEGPTTLAILVLIALFYVRMTTLPANQLQPAKTIPARNTR